MLQDFHLWSFLTGLLAGGVGLKIAGFIATWLNSKGVQLVEDKLKAFGERLNQGQILGQIQADDAVLKIVENALPSVVAKLTEDIQADVKNGKLDADSWKKVASDLWATAEPQIKGGAVDYLKQSSFMDGMTVTNMVLQKFLGQQKLNTNGIVTDPPRAEVK